MVLPALSRCGDALLSVLCGDNPRNRRCRSAGPHSSSSLAWPQNFQESITPRPSSWAVGLLHDSFFPKQNCTRRTSSRTQCLALMAVLPANSDDAFPCTTAHQNQIPSPDKWPSRVHPEQPKQFHTWPKWLLFFLTLLSLTLLLSSLRLPAFASTAAAPNSGCATVATSGVGIKIAQWLRQVAGSRLPDEAIVLLLASLPVVELRGAIPVAYWMGMTPLKASLLAVLGNMIPVPFILLGLGPLQESLSAKAKKGLQWFLDYTRAKADPIAEFQALGLMLFVAVPLPGTGAWSGAIAAHILRLPFWEAFWANFFGVVLAGTIVSALCLLGFREALLLAAGLFILSGVMWSALRAFLPKK